jgi:ATP-binding cassette subfamily C protein
MSPKERAKYYTFLGLRAVVSSLDLAGILAIGFLATSIALFLTRGSDPSRVVEVAGIVIPAITAQSLPIVSVLILILFIGKALVSIFLTMQLALFLAKVEARAAREIARLSFGRGLKFGSRNSREEVMFAVQEGSPNTFNNLLNATGVIVAEGFLFTLILVLFGAVNPLAAFWAVLFFGIIGLVMSRILGRLMQKTGQQLTSAAVEANTLIGDISEVIREAEVSGTKDFFLDKIYSARLRAAGNYAKQYVLTGMPRYIIETALIMALAAFILLQAFSGDLVSSAATIGVFLSGGLRLTASLLPLQAALLQIKQAQPIADRALHILENIESRRSVLRNDSRSSKGQQLERGPLEVVSQRLDFNYEASSKKVLSDVSFAIPAGAQVAFIGPSGAGKSTLADVILGLQEPSGGRITVGGLDPSQMNDFYPGLLGYVPQKPGMISGTILNNVVIGVDEQVVDIKRLDQALSAANLTDLISSLPNGLQTNLGKSKDELSGGQLQRLGLARALYTKPGLLIMDEATSALDADSENEINKALDSMRGKVTVILIAHRLNTVQRSDVVFLLEDGRITASGTFPELLRTNKTVQNLADLMSINSVG